jgi:hypothetical protein
MFKKTLSPLSCGKRLPFAVVLGLLFIYADLAHGQGTLPDCYVLSAGIDNYTHVGKLKGDVNDARNTAAAFAAQQGKLFTKVWSQMLLDGQATRHNIVQRAQSIAKAGKAGDYMVLFLSGHGGVLKETGQWYFCPCDFDPANPARTAITDRQLLETADAFVRQAKKVLIIIDTCFSGQLRVAAQPYLVKYRDPNGGGLIIMVSSAADQTSNALGDYSAFAKAFSDSMAGGADLNHDGTVTLEEIRQFSGKRTYELLQKQGNSAKQDSSVAWSPSISANLALAVAGRTYTPPGNAAEWRTWTDNENLPGYGPPASTFAANGRSARSLSTVGGALAREPGRRQEDVRRSPNR